jgi:hypothetical protein
MPYIAGRQVAVADHSRRFLQIRDQGWREAADVENRRESDTDTRFPERARASEGSATPAADAEDYHFGDEPVPFYAVAVAAARSSVVADPRFVFAGTEVRMSVTLAIDPTSNDAAAGRRRSRASSRLSRFTTGRWITRRRPTTTSCERSCAVPAGNSAWRSHRKPRSSSTRCAASS